MNSEELSAHFRSTAEHTRNLLLQQYAGLHGLDPANIKGVPEAVKKEPRSMIPILHTLRVAIVQESSPLIPIEFSLGSVRPSIPEAEQITMVAIVNQALTFVADGFEIAQELVKIRAGDTFRPKTAVQKRKLTETPTLHRYHLIKDDVTSDYEPYTKRGILDKYFGDERVQQIAQLAHAPDGSWKIRTQARTQLGLSFTFLSYVFLRIGLDTHYYGVGDFFANLASAFRQSPQVPGDSLGIPLPGWNVDVTRLTGAPAKTQTRRRRDLPGSMKSLPDDVKPPLRIPRPKPDSN